MKFFQLFGLVLLIILSSILIWRYRPFSPSWYRPDPFYTSVPPLTIGSLTVGAPVTSAPPVSVPKGAKENLSSSSSEGVRGNSLEDTDIAEYKSFYVQLKEAFPPDYARISAEISAPALQAHSTPDTQLLEALRQLQSLHGMAAAHASTEALLQIFSVQLAILTTLSQNGPHLCQGFLYGLTSAGYLRFVAQHRTLIGAMANATLHAILDGRAQNISREVPSSAQFHELEEALKKSNLNPNEISALLEGKPPAEPLSDERMCQAGIIYLTVLQNLAEPTRSSILALAVKLLIPN